MTRCFTIIVTMMGVLMMSMPGGACFIWSGLGVDHHHHADAERGADQSDVACFDEHEGCGDETHPCDTESESEPQRPCSPDSQDMETLAFAPQVKIDPAAQLEIEEFVPDWALSPEPKRSGQSATGTVIRAAIAAGTKPPPLEARLCRFML